MHPFFEPLDEREAMLLLTTLTVGTKDDIALFAHLPPESKGRLDEKANALLAIEAEKRVPFMVKQIKQALNFKGLRGVEKMDPSWLLAGMKGESPRIVATILISLPPQTVRSILKRLPSAVRKHLPPKDEIKLIPMELVRSVRQMFESRFHRMPAPSAKGFGFRDVIQLDRKELFKLMRDLGLIELGQAFVMVGRMALAELCRSLPRDKAQELIMAVKHASTIDAPTLKTAQHFLSRVVANFNDTEEFFQKSGLWRLAKCALIESDEFRIAFKQRLPKDAGQMFEGYLEKASVMDELDEATLKRLQDTVLLRILMLSEKGAINARWHKMEMLLHDPQSLESLNPPTAEEPEEGDPLADPEPPEEAPPESAPPPSE